MFNPKTQRILKLAEIYPKRIAEMEAIFNKRTNIYIDYANVRPWSQKLGWHVDLKRLKQFLDSFDTVNEIKFYQGTLKGKEQSETIIKQAGELGYIVKTKPVKIMKISIDASSVPNDSTELLKEFIRQPLLAKFRIETIQMLNKELKSLNQQG